MRWAWREGGRNSAIPEDTWTVVASYGPSAREESVEFTVRGVPVSLVRGDVGGFTDSRGIAYRWCVFPDRRVMLVNEGNIHSRKVGRYGTNANESQAAPSTDRGHKRSARAGAVLRKSAA